jgi:serine/threonine protein phosphatase PrpC
LAKDANKEYRPYMEDGHVVLDPLPSEGDDKDEQWSFFAVYDGHGGRREVQHCEERFHTLIASEIAGHQCRDRKAIQSVVTTAFKNIDDELATLGSLRSGCTATVALAKRLSDGGVELHVGNVGDSRALLVGSFGTKRLSIDHRTTDPSEAARVRREGGFMLNGRVGGALNLTRSLGDHYLKPGVTCEPDFCTHMCASPDEAFALVIASDGLWDSVDDDEVEEVLTEHVQSFGMASDTPSTREDVANTLVERAKARGSKDNVLVLVVFF